MRLYADSPRCVGCQACKLACAFSHFQENNPRKRALDIIPHFPDPGTYEVRVCTQCGTCAEVCPVEAIYQNDKGAYYIEPEECTACGTCVEECPEQVIFYIPGREEPFKCDLCGYCVEVCGMNVLSIAE
ncbi:MAG: 4Fe-4S binding protein [Chloroflexia bacterium]|nr:4Fe-4S binding protein [Chloroflexia bacterium]